MKIPLDKIHAPSLKISATTAEAWVNAATKTVRGTPGEPTQDPHEDEGAETAAIELTVRRKGVQVHVTGTIAVALICACDRCGNSTRLRIEGEVDQLYQPPQTEADPADYDLVQTELEMGWHDGQALDLEMVLTEALALIGPDRVRCDDDGVERIVEGEPCVLPEDADGGGPSKTNPFAALKLS
jgi:uncharacterized metal-binding protein YceD (DUF177 family)